MTSSRYFLINKNLMGKYVHFTDILSADNDSYQKLDYTVKAMQPCSKAFFEIMMIIHKYTVLVRFSCRVELERI